MISDYHDLTNTLLRIYLNDLSINLAAKDINTLENKLKN